MFNNPYIMYLTMEKENSIRNKTTSKSEKDQTDIVCIADQLRPVSVGTIL